MHEGSSCFDKQAELVTVLSLAAVVAGIMAAAGLLIKRDTERSRDQVRKWAQGYSPGLTDAGGGEDSLAEGLLASTEEGDSRRRRRRGNRRAVVGLHRAGGAVVDPDSLQRARAGRRAVAAAHPERRLRRGGDRADGCRRRGARRRLSDRHNWSVRYL